MNNTTQVYQPILEKIIRKHLPHAAIYLFGSRALGVQGQGSDIDLGLDNGKPIKAEIILTLYSDIEDSIIPVHVDLVDISIASEALRKEILTQGVLWRN